MRILTDTPQTLVMAHPPLWLAAALVLATLGSGWVAVALARAGDWPGTAMIGAGAALCLGATVLMARPMQLRLDQTAGTFTLTGEPGPLPLSMLLGAETGQGRAVPTVGVQRGTRASLVLSDGRRLPLSPVFSSAREASRDATVINRWLQATGGAASD